jgi:GTPase SAR1 family protein
VADELEECTPGEVRRIGELLSHYGQVIDRSAPKIGPEYRNRVTERVNRSLGRSARDAPVEQPSATRLHSTESSVRDVNFGTVESVLRDHVGELVVALRALGHADLADHLANRYERIGAPTARLVVIGAAKSGKSTFLNALLGREYLPESALPSLAAPTVVRGCAAGAEGVTLQFRDPWPPGLAMPEFLRDHLRQSSPGSVSPFRCSMERLQELSEFQSMLATSFPVALGGLERIEVDSSSAICQSGVELVEVPDLDGEWMDEATIAELLGGADAIAYLVSCADGLRPRDLRLLEQLTGHGRGYNVLVICNRLDAIESRDFEAFIAWMRTQLAPRLEGTPLGSEGIFFVSAQAALEAKQSHADGLLAVSGWPPLERALWQTLVTERRRTRSATIVTDIVEKLEALPRSLQENLPMRGAFDRLREFLSQN